MKYLKGAHSSENLLCYLQLVQYDRTAMENPADEVSCCQQPNARYRVETNGIYLSNSMRVVCHCLPSLRPLARHVFLISAWHTHRRLRRTVAPSCSQDPPPSMSRRVGSGSL